MSIAQIVDECIEASFVSAYVALLFSAGIVGAQWGPELVLAVVG